MRKLLLLFILLFYRAAIAEQYSHLIYQGTSDTVLALRFIDTPNEKVEILKPLVRGELANQELITFANQIIQARETRNVNLYESLIHQEGLDHSEEILTTIIEKISDGSLMYGGHGYKYFVTSEPIADRLLNKIFRKNVNKPSITLTFYHYHRRAKTHSALLPCRGPRRSINLTFA